MSIERSVFQFYVFVMVDHFAMHSKSVRLPIDLYHLAVLCIVTIRGDGILRNFSNNSQFVRYGTTFP